MFVANFFGQSWEPVTSIGRKWDGHLVATEQDAYILFIARLSPTHLGVRTSIVSILGQM